jgi:hypothetical protein
MIEVATEIGHVRAVQFGATKLRERRKPRDQHWRLERGGRPRMNFGQEFVALLVETHGPSPEKQRYRTARMPILRWSVHL